MAKTPFRLSLAILLVYFIATITQSFVWRLVTSYGYVVISTLIFMASILMLPIFMIISIKYIINNWKRIKLLTYLPILTLVLSMWASISVPLFAIRYQEDRIFKVKRDKFEDVVKMTEKGLFPKKSGWYLLPKGHRYLTADGNVRLIFRNRGFEVWFPLRCHIGAGDFIVFSSADQLAKNEYLVVQKKASNWYLAIETP